MGNSAEILQGWFSFALNLHTSYTADNTHNWRHPDTKYPNAENQHLTCFLKFCTYHGRGNLNIRGSVHDILYTIRRSARAKSWSSTGYVTTAIEGDRRNTTRRTGERHGPGREKLLYTEAMGTLSSWRVNYSNLILILILLVAHMLQPRWHDLGHTDVSAGCTQDPTAI